MPTRRYVVSGNVQGVGFRSFVVDRAWDLQVTGEVWNRLDGRVELVATHPDSAVLDQLKAVLSAGPGRVNDVKAEESLDVTEAGFKVTETR